MVNSQGIPVIPMSFEFAPPSVGFGGMSVENQPATILDGLTQERRVAPSAGTLQDPGRPEVQWKAAPRPECGFRNCTLFVSENEAPGTVTFLHVWGQHQHVRRIKRDVLQDKEEHGVDLMVRKMLTEFHSEI